MDPIEKAIRAALDKGDADDPEFRDRIYRSVEAALDRAIQANPQLTVEKAIARRRGLQEKIVEIEAEFAPALPDDAAAFDRSLDAALLDILERSPVSRQPTKVEPAPQWPDAPPPRSAPPPPPPVVASRETVRAAPSAPATVPRSEPSVSLPPPVSARDDGLARVERSLLARRDEPAFGGEPVQPATAVSASAPVVAPEIALPRREAPPQVAAPQIAAPEVAAPEVTTPEMAAPEMAAPEVAVVETAAPPFRAAPEPSIDLGVVPDASGRLEPELDFQVLPPPLDDPDISSPVPQSPPEIIAADRAARSREKRRPFAALFFGIALLSLAAVGFMFAFQTGLLKSPQERDTSVPNPAPELGSEDFDPAAGGPPALSDQPASQQNWITVFSPADPATASAPADTKADAMQDDSGSFLRIRSGASGSAVSFDVGQGVLEQLAGKKAVFNVVARGEEGQETEISIECNFGDLGDCGRKRYLIGYDRREYLFEIEFPKRQPGSSGTIAINSDFSGQGKAIDVYEIRAAAQ